MDLQLAVHSGVPAALPRVPAAPGHQHSGDPGLARAVAPVAADAALLHQLTDAVLTQNVRRSVRWSRRTNSSGSVSSCVTGSALPSAGDSASASVRRPRRFRCSPCRPVQDHDQLHGECTTTVGDLAFTSTIPLIGILPDGTAPDALEYHFRFEKYPLGGGPSDVVATMIPPTRIGELEYKEWNGVSWFTNSADYWVNNPGATVSIAQQFGPPLVVSVNKDVKPVAGLKSPAKTVVQRRRRAFHSEHRSARQSGHDES